jgi:hypothetical protein
VHLKIRGVEPDNLARRPANVKAVLTDQKGVADLCPSILLTVISFDSLIAHGRHLQATLPSHISQR